MYTINSINSYLLLLSLELLHTAVHVNDIPGRIVSIRPPAKGTCDINNNDITNILNVQVLIVKV